MPETPKNRRSPYFGDFVLFNEIGRGGMGVVYNAQQTKLDRPVALKVLHSGVASAEAGFQRLRIEAEAAARLEHPYIVPIFEIGEHEGHPYLAMQLVEGESLAERIARLGSKLKEKDAAILMAKIARAVHHAHQRGVLHRDLKPGNILMDEGGEPHLIDFGLAKCVEQDSGLTQTGAFLGTPAYASPEQAAGQNKSVTTASDIYSLGAILYALLTGNPPFVGESTAEIIGKVQNQLPLRPRFMRQAISANLETICLKCLEKEPARRYVTALAMAEDIERFLDGRPITARPVATLERLWLWIQRNPGHAALWATAILVALAFMTGAFVWRNDRAKGRQRELLTQQLVITRLTPHVAGWSTQAWHQAVEAANIRTKTSGDELKDQAAALLAGLDAYQLRPFTNSGASSVMFDRKGERILMGGLGDGAKVWDGRAGEIHISPRTNSGPVAFTDDESAVELIYDAKRHSLVLSDIFSQQRKQEWKIPEYVGPSEVLTNPPILLALTPDGASVTAVLALADGRQAVVAAFQSDIFHPVEVLSSPASALAISAEGSLVAVAESEARIAVWSVKDERCVATLSGDRSQVTHLALKHVSRVSESRGQDLDGAWLLAVGDSGGTVTLWDVRTEQEKAHYRGGHHGIDAIAFSPDGTTMASGGRGPVKLWDVVTERSLLDIPVGGAGEYITGLDFALDGNRLAISTQGGSLHPMHVSIWNLEFGRGIQTLRGLSGQVSKVCFSADGRKVAALSHKWEVGIWDLPTGQLLRVIEVPTGYLADNAAIAFSPSGERVAFSAWKTAQLWNVKSGAELRPWSLPPGSVDVMSFPDENHLLLLRVETLDGIVAAGDSPPARHPRVCRIRNLLGTDWLKPVAEIQDFNWQVFNTAATPDGRWFVVEGMQGDDSKSRILLKAYDGFTGKELWWAPSTKKNRGSGVIAIDATGKFITYQAADVANAVLAELSTGKPIEMLAEVPSAIGPGGGLYAVRYLPSVHDRGCSLFNDAKGTPLVTLGIDGGPAIDAKFDPAGNQLAWGNTDGTVTVCNLKEIRARLDPLGLAW